MPTTKTAAFATTLGARIRHARTAAGLSQVALGEALGISFQQVQKYELGRSHVSAEALARIAGALQLPPTEFFAAAPAVVPIASLATREHSRIADVIGRLPPKVRKSVMSLAETLAPAAPVEDAAPEPVAQPLAA